MNAGVWLGKEVTVQPQFLASTVTTVVLFSSLGSAEVVFLLLGHLLEEISPKNIQNSLPCLISDIGLSEKSRSIFLFFDVQKVS